MAEVGLLPFARVALQVATRVLPPYRTRFSKHQFTQPQLLAVLCLMRFEDWTFREAEVRLREHQELRAALQLQAVPDYTTLYRFLRRLEDDTVDRGLSETVRRLRRRRRRPVSAAIDGTGLSDTSVSTFFLKRLEQHAHGTRPRRPWLKWLIVVDTCSSRFCWRSGLVKGRGATRALCRDCSMWRHKALLSVWYWRMRSLTPKPTTSTFGNAWERRASFPPDATGSPMAPFGIRCSEPFRKNRIGSAPRSKASSRLSNASSPRVHRDAA